MLTKNFCYMSSGQSAYGLTNTAQGAQYAPSISANVATANAYITNTTAGYYVDVGFDDTEPDVSDYKLGDSNAVDTQKLTFVSSTSTGGVLPYIRYVTTVYRNDTADDVTVKEVGLVSKSTLANRADRNYLLTHEILETPIVVHAGETYSFIVNLEI